MALCPNQPQKAIPCPTERWLQEVGGQLGYLTRLDVTPGPKPDGSCFYFGPSAPSHIRVDGLNLEMLSKHCSLFLCSLGPRWRPSEEPTWKNKVIWYQGIIHFLIKPWWEDNSPLPCLSIITSLVPSNATIKGRNKIPLPMPLTPWSLKSVWREASFLWLSQGVVVHLIFISPYFRSMTLWASEQSLFHALSLPWPVAPTEGAASPAASHS